MKLRFFLCICAFAFSAPNLLAQFTSPGQMNVPDTSLSGEWRGNVISQQGLRFQILLHIEAMESGDCSVRYDVVDQRHFGRHMSSASCDNGKLQFINDSVNASFIGRLIPESQEIQGVWEQSRTRAPVRFFKVYPVVRFQEPVGTLPYETRELEVNNNVLGISLTGTLVVPNNNENHPLFILINDRGELDRDGLDGSGHRPFLVLADAFARRGWASLRLDDRGRGNSTPLKDQGIDDLISDITAAVDRVQSEQNIDAQNIVLLGHGEGGLIAAEVARRRPQHVKAIVFAATPAMESKHWFVAHAQETDRLLGIDEEDTKLAIQTTATWYDIMKKTSDTEERVRFIGMVTDTMFKRHPQLKMVYPMAGELQKPDRDSYIREQIIPWIQEFIDADPSHRLGKISKPALVLLAENDALVPPRFNEPAWEAVAHQQEHIQLEFLKGVNHRFQECGECTIEEAAHSAQTVSPSVIDEIVAWSKRTVERR